MKRWLATMTLSSLMTVCGPNAGAQQFSGAISLKSGVSPADSPELPPLPRGKTTIFGGEIRNVDPVRDQLTLGVFGERPMRILFDVRTEIFRDGKRIPLRDLGETGHASVETTLDGTKLFAVSVHILSGIPEGEYEGRILNYNPSTGELSIASGRSPEAIKMLVQRETSIVRKGQSKFVSTPSGPADLINGTLVSVQFAAAKNQGAVASQIEILAVPGTTFVFSGNISSIDMRAGLFVLDDSQDQQDHPIFFNSATVPLIQSVHLGDGVRVVARYDGTHYIADEISVNKP
jgi:hypothetical protein